jgi:hypothetical protein
VLYTLDREAYRFTIAQSSNNRSAEVKAALAKAPLLSNLTDEQLEKVNTPIALQSL